MSDTKAGRMEVRQRYADEIEVMQTHLDGRQTQIHTAMPGIIVSFNPAKMTVVVQPAIQGMQQKTDGTVAPITISTIGDVPVHFPSGGGHTLTFPIKPGDGCLIVFSERNIDNWYQQGGVQPPRDYRMHDMSDAFVLVGLRPQTQVLGAGGGTMRAAGPATHADSAQLRSDDGQTVITLNGGGNGINIKTSTSTIDMNGKTGNIAMDSPTGISLTTPMTSINGNMGVTGKAGGGNVTLTAPLVTINAASVVINGDLTVTGAITAGTEVTAQRGVRLSAHTHPGTGPPNDPEREVE